MDIEKINRVGGSTAISYKKKGIEYVEQIMCIPPPQIAPILGIDNESANDLFLRAHLAWKKEHPQNMFTNANEIDEESVPFISTGTKALDKLFDGGIACSSTTEIFGEFGCGKTQFSLSMSVRVQLPVEQGGLDGKCVYIDSEKTFNKKRVIEISESLGMDSDKCLNNIIHASAINSVDQKLILVEAQKLLIKDPTIKLIVIDSATGLFRQDFSGMGMLSERQKYMDEFLTLASNISKLHNIAVIWTNQVYIKPTFFGDGITAVGGTVLAHKSTYRVYFSKSGKFRIAKMVDSPKSAETEVMFGLSKSGVVDMDVAKQEADDLKKELTDMKKKAKTGKIDETEESDD